MFSQGVIEPLGVFAAIDTEQLRRIELATLAASASAPTPVPLAPALIAPVGPRPLTPAEVQLSQTVGGVAVTLLQFLQRQNPPDP